jgi:hypothetical protein
LVNDNLELNTDFAAVFIQDFGKKCTCRCKLHAQ